MKKIASLWLSLAIFICLLPGCSKNDAGNAKSEATGPAADKASVPDGPIELKAKWQAGKSYRQRMTMNQTMNMSMPGVDKPMQTDTEMEMEMEYLISAIAATADGGAELEIKFISEKISSKMAGREISAFDSTSDPSTDGANPMAPVLRKLIGAHTRMVVGADGNVEKVEDYDAFIKQISSGVSPQSRAMLQGMFNEDSLKQFGARSQGLPGKPVKIGDTWPMHMDMGSAAIGKMKMDLKYKFEGWEQHDEHNCVLLTHTGTIASVPPKNSQEVKVSIDKGNSTGKTWFDPELGTVIDTGADQTMALKMSVQGKEIKSKMDQHVTVKLAGIEDNAK